MSVNFRPNIDWPNNDLLLPAEWFERQNPAGLEFLLYPRSEFRGHHHNDEIVER